MAKTGTTFLIAVAVLAASASIAQADSPTLDKIRSSGTLTIGYRESSVPFSYLGADQKPVGISIDLCEAVAQKIKTALNLPELQVDYTAVNASNRIPLIQNGTVDLECGSTTNTAERQKQVAFSVATFVSQTSWLASAASGLTGADSLKGKTVVITQGSLNLALSEKINRDKGLELTILQAKEQAESLLMVKTGRASAWFEDNILQAGLVAASADPKAFVFLPDSYGAFTYYGLMLPKGDGEFKDLVDGVIKEKMASGEFTKLYEKWFTQPIAPNNQNLALPMSAALKDRVAKPSDALTP